VSGYPVGPGSALTGCAGAGWAPTSACLMLPVAGSGSETRYRSSDPSLRTDRFVSRKTIAHQADHVNQDCGRLVSPDAVRHDSRSPNRADKMTVQEQHPSESLESLTDE
jgi:hypothetical protein